MGGLIILAQIAEEEGPVIEEELAPVGEAIAAEAEVLAKDAEAAAQVVEAEAEKLAQAVEAEGKTILSKIEEILGNGQVDKVTTVCETQKGEPPAAGEAFHYTFEKFLSSIERNGLRQGSYATTTGELSPLQAQLDLALSPNRGLPNALLRIDLAGLRAAGYEIPEVTTVGRSFNMPGGSEMQFPYPIPPEFISVVPK